MRIKLFIYDIGQWDRPLPASPFAHALGGRETAQIRIAQELAKIGHDVDLYIPNTHQDDGPITVDGVTWHHPAALLKEGPKVDAVVVSVESFALFEKVTGILNVIQAQCCHFQPSDKPTPKTEALTHVYALLSHFQRWSLKNRDPIMDPLKACVFGNGVDVEAFDQLGDIERIPGRFHWSSSPDRGLWHLVRLWPELKNAYPDITLSVYYGETGFIEVARWMHELRAERARTIDLGRDLPGVTYHGASKQSVVHGSMRASSLLVYTADTLWETESYAITMLEAAAAGLPMLLSPVDCLSEVYGNVAHFAPLPIKDTEWLGAISHLLDHPDERTKYVAAGRRLAEDQTWALVARRWSDFLTRRLELDDSDVDGIADLISATEDRRLPVAPA